MNSEEQCTRSLIRIASETYRFRKVFHKVLSQLDAVSANKYLSQYAWFEKSVQKALSESGLEIVEMQGQMYDPGMPLTPINLDDFPPDEPLYIQQMMEPVIMRDGSVLKTGTAILGLLNETCPIGE